MLPVFEGSGGGIGWTGGGAGVPITDGGCGVIPGRVLRET